MNKNDNLILQALMILLETFEVGKQLKSPTWKAFIILQVLTRNLKNEGRLVVCHILPAFKDLTKLEVLRLHFVT